MAVAAAIVYSGVMSFILLKLIALVMPLRADAETRATASTSREHGEEAYVHGGGSQSAMV